MNSKIPYTVSYLCLFLCACLSFLEKIISRIDIVEMIIHVIYVKMINYELYDNYEIYY